jgi:hypothetical protein
MVVFFGGIIKSMSMFSQISWKNIAYISFLYTVTTVYVMAQQVPLSELIFMYLFSMLVSFAFILLRLCKDSPIIGLISMFTGGIFALVFLIFTTVLTVEIYFQPEDIKSTYIQTIHTLLIPIALLSLGKVHFLFTPVIGPGVGFRRYKKVLLLLLSPYVLGFYISAILVLAILIQNINYYVAVLFFMGFAALSELFVAIFTKRTTLSKIAN